MRVRGAAFTLAVLALALGASACGGGGSPKTTSTTAAERAAVDHWRAGLVRWQRSMAGALDGISVVFSTDAGLLGIQTNGTREFKELVRDERALASCTIVVGQLGPAPEEFSQARAYALMACGNFERGERYVEAAVRQVRHSTPLDPLDSATGPLSTGESEMQSAGLALTSAPE